MFHPDCTRCCAAGRCHFCLAPARHTAIGAPARDGVDGNVLAPARDFRLGDDGREYRLCTAHLAWITTSDYAPKLRELPVSELPLEIVNAPRAYGSARQIEMMQRHGDLSPPALLR